MNNSLGEQLPYLSSQERLQAYNMIVDGCSHIWSKNQIQSDKAMNALKSLIPLTSKDPYFLAHLTSYVIRKTKNKDLQVFTTYANSLSTADGTPFSPGSKYIKPNLRFVSSAAVQQLEPKLVNRVLEIAMTKYAIENQLNEARHFPTALRTAFNKYLSYREANLNMTRGLKKAGLGNVMRTMYRTLHRPPSDEVAAILRWQQKNKKIKFEESLLNFKGLDDLAIAEKIQKEKLPVLGVLGALPRQVSPVIAVALLEQATGNQAVILKTIFDEAGVLKDPEVMKLFQEKIATAKTALDRAETLSENASLEVKQALSQARGEVRKEATRGLGKIFMHIDFSSSMTEAIEFAQQRAAIIAECVDNPTQNFRWGLFGSHGKELSLPQEFVQDAFRSMLFGLTPNGSTNCFALYPTAREFGAEIDVYVTDQGHNMGDLGYNIRKFHEDNPSLSKPKAVVIVNFQTWDNQNQLKAALEENSIPVALMNPNTLTESALVVEAVRSAMFGPVALIDEIMETELLKLPEYYYAI
jgi:hypothetical protein